GGLEGFGPRLAAGGGAQAGAHRCHRLMPHAEPSVLDDPRRRIPGRLAGPYTAPRSCRRPMVPRRRYAARAPPSSETALSRETIVHDEPIMDVAHLRHVELLT